MILDEEQKAVFVRWLEVQIASSAGIQEQMQKTALPAFVVESFVKKEQAERRACEIVLHMITSGETMTVCKS